MTDRKSDLPSKSSTQVDEFLRKVATTPVVKSSIERGRLIFAMDATASREPSWDRACQIQGKMFEETAALGGLDIQLAYYRGYGEFNASLWHNKSQDLLKEMSSTFCLGGMTQIEKILRHAVYETKRKKVHALVFIGDCMEEDAGLLYDLAGELGILGVPVFIFQEGHDPSASQTFRQIAKLTMGAYLPFDTNSAQQLRDLLSAVAVFAAGGRKALEDFSRRKGGITLQLTHQIAITR